MAIYHLSMKTISRSAGRSSTAAAAYRAGCEITDERTGEIHDYRRKAGVESANIVLPDGMPLMSRSDLWNGIEKHHKRGDAVVAREFEVALPSELSPAERQRLALDFAKEVANHYGVAADVCLHLPGKEGDQRNHHAHILFSACTVSREGFGKKAAELDPIHCKKHQVPTPADLWRPRWAELCNQRLKENGIAVQVDHRSLEDQGINRLPTSHLGPTVTGMERRGVDTKVKKLIAEQTAEALKVRAEISATIKVIEDLSAALDAEKAKAQDFPAAPARPPAIDSLPIEQQVQIFERDQRKLAAERQAKARRVAQKAWERYQRREKAADDIWRDKPTEPTGLLAVLKKKAYDEALAVWDKAWSHARKLQGQANSLYGKLVDAAENSQVLSWAYNRLKAKDPALVQQVEAHRKTERQRNLSTELQTHQAKKKEKNRSL